jgi:hypothetical protein
LWTAYTTISSGPPKVDASLAAVIVAVFALFSLIAGYAGVRKLRSRMGILVGEALTELNEMSGPWRPSARRQPA